MSPGAISMENVSVKLQVDHEFNSLIPPLSDEERAALEASLLAEGCRDALVVWHGIILDGHNRYAICQQHGLPFHVVEKDFATRDEAKLWIIDNQLARRNLPPYERARLALLRAPLLKASKEKGKFDQNSDQTYRACDRTLEKLARDSGVSHDTIHKVETIETHAPVPIRQAARAGELSVHRAYLLTRALEKLPDAERDRAAALCGDEPGKADILVRLYKSSQSPASNGTYEEILRTGGFHYGDELEGWCDFATATVEEINDGLKSLSLHHKLLAVAARPHIAYHSGDNEWYTPPEYIHAARAVMGDIDLDPVSTALTNSVVRARTFYSVAEDGLTQPWQGRVWLNPPYASELIGLFCDKLIEHFQAGEVVEAIVLVNNATDTLWFQRLAQHACAIAFPRGRVRFWHPQRDRVAPLQGQAVLYLGPHGEAFIHEFKVFGVVCRVV